jgi:hypothetical protein
MFQAMLRFVPGVGAATVVTGGGPPLVVGEDEDEEGEGEEDEPEDGDGRVASFGVPTRLSVLAAASTRIICWRCASSRAPERLPGIAARAAAVGSAPPPALLIATKTPAAIATSTVIVVTRRKLIGLRPRRLA